MNELSLFTGAGGGVLASKLLGWTTVGYVEIDDYCQRVLQARIKDGIFDDAPIFGDIKAFISEGYAGSYQGMVDVVSGGFPCQPFSVAGQRKGSADDRNMWPAMLSIIRLVRPRYAFMENVPGLVSNGYLDRVIGDLTESGYDSRWRILSAAEVGAQHKRDRLWIVATSHTDNGKKQFMADTGGEKRNIGAGLCAQESEVQRSRRFGHSGSNVSNSRRWNGERARGEISRGEGSTWWKSKPGLGGTFDDVAQTMDLVDPHESC